MATLQERYTEALTKRGYREVNGISRKFRVFLNERTGTHYYVGKSGAVRIGKTIAASYALGETHKQILLRELA